MLRSLVLLALVLSLFGCGRKTHPIAYHVETSGPGSEIAGLAFKVLVLQHEVDARNEDASLTEAASSLEQLVSAKAELRDALRRSATVRAHETAGYELTNGDYFVLWWESHNGRKTEYVMRYPSMEAEVRTVW